MLHIAAVTKPQYKVRRSAALKPKYAIGQAVEVRMLIEDEELLIDHGIVQGFAYLSYGYECHSRSGATPAPGFSYCVSFGGSATELVNERELFSSEVTVGRTEGGTT